MKKETAEMILEDNTILIEGGTVEPDEKRGTFRIKIYKDKMGFFYYDLLLLNVDGSPRLNSFEAVPLGIDNVMGFVENALKGDNGVSLKIV